MTQRTPDLPVVGLHASCAKPPVKMGYSGPSQVFPPRFYLLSVFGMVLVAWGRPRFRDGFCVPNPSQDHPKTVPSPSQTFGMISGCPKTIPKMTSGRSWDGLGWSWDGLGMVQEHPKLLGCSIPLFWLANSFGDGLTEQIDWLRQNFKASYWPHKDDRCQQMVILSLRDDRIFMSFK